MDNKKKDDELLEGLLDDDIDDDIEEENFSDDDMEEELGGLDDFLEPPKVQAPLPSKAKEPPQPVKPSASEDVLDFASDIPVQLVAVMGKKTSTMQDLMDLTVGEVVELSRPLNESVDLVANGKLIARGELVDIDGKMGVKIIKMVK
ncbi:FliM/FliN family flagellar motor switch protein [bacterium]|nr:FliM/FliN family flagellar motor switch protein [bacterium]